MNQHELRRFYDNITASVEGHITAEQFADLKKTLREDPEALQYYVDYMSISCHFRFSTEIPESEEEYEEINESSLDMELWSELAQYEAQAATVELNDSSEFPEKELIQKVEYQKVSKTINKFPLISAITGIAAIILLVLILHFVPVPVQVAVLEDSINARWENNAFPTEQNSLFSTNRGLMILDEGVVKLFFNNGARIIVEAPASFEILSDSEVQLHNGRLFARVPREAIGFAISSKNSKIIDLGTNFGVQVSENDGLSVHVTKGKVQLSAGLYNDEEPGSSQLVTEKQAMKTSANEMTISSITYNDKIFVQDISSAEGIIWRGEDLDLVDITAGGKGYGDKSPFCAIDPASGQITRNRNVVEIKFKLSTQYSTVNKLPAIDGVFTPDGRNEPVIISSQGHLFENCPETCAQWFVPIMTETVPLIHMSDQGEMILKEKTIKPPILNNYTYGIQGYKPALTLHANVGITYDLDVIRAYTPGKITRFTALCGLSESVVDEDLKSDIWFLVDGQMKAHYSVDGENRVPRQITFELKDTDRFLTLAATDGANWNRNDWLVVAEPVLTVED